MRNKGAWFLATWIVFMVLGITCTITVLDSFLSEPATVVEYVYVPTLEPVDMDQLQTDIVVHGVKYVMCGTSNEQIFQICDMERNVRFTMKLQGMACNVPPETLGEPKVVDRLTFFYPYENCR